MSERLEPQNFRKDGSKGFGEMGVPHFWDPFVCLSVYLSGILGLDKLASR